MKNNVFYITDTGHNQQFRDGIQYIQESTEQTIPKKRVPKQGLTEARKVLWNHLMIHSGEIKQPWYDKLLQFREES